MRIVVAGAHGKVGQLLVHALKERGDGVVALVRSASQILPLTDLGAEVSLIDLEHDDAADVSFTMRGSDAVVFAAGAGPGSGAERKDTVDRAGALLLADAAELAGITRYVLVSSMGVESVADGAAPDGVDDVFVAYLRAKAAAEEELRSRDLALTIVRPGRLTDGEGTGHVRLKKSVDPGEITRTDVAGVLAEVLHEPRSAGLTLELVAGTSRVDDAVYKALPKDAL
ncbi:NAD-dependent dehydratase [Paraoerskovia sediminicola]|uniref:NAD-dependent dehydratase n=1 Tax=Paraoerskovia sediminicola TaxID=1138587 RepID=A0ABN6XCB1_9CELL|nr:NAD(P)H-binding protein [Paraoerskovia sediminicola]BDZ42471.1 NAD-dependent dehydratase [Paraoerskovia sediminicola]